MEKSTQDSLCKGLRACGIPKKQSLQILNTVIKWDRCNGSEWVVTRIKSLRQWYETCLGGSPKPPEWFRHTKDGYPTGIWNWVFHLPNAKALGVLSLDTVYYEKGLSASQKEKFLKGLRGNGKPDPRELRRLLEPLGRSPRRADRIRPKTLDKFRLPSIFDMTGSIPVNGVHKAVRTDGTLRSALNALAGSWDSVPQVTFDFLLEQGLDDAIPINVIGNDYQLELNRPHQPHVGRIGIIQEPELKARIVANPNRITQVTLEPLKNLFLTTARRLKADCTYNQDKGCRWAQDQLRQGITLAGCDLTSATDLLDLDLSLELIDAMFYFHEIEGYQENIQYFKQVSRSTWYFPEMDTTVRWEQGDPMGTGPSFGILTLTNFSAGRLASYMARRNDPTIPHDCFRSVGDDIIMDARIVPEYLKVIKALGGEINFTKTLESNRVAEFAGRVITPQAIFQKKINYKEMSDNNFMSVMSQLGDQAKYFLKPKQRQVYNLFKEVPGVAVDGPWMGDSYGIPFSERYQWYLEEVQPAMQRVEPDLELHAYEYELLIASLSAAEANEAIDMARQLPWPMEEDYLSSQVTRAFKSGGDPRLTDGKTTLDVLYEHLESGRIRPFAEWKRSREEVISLLSEEPNANERQGDVPPTPLGEKSPSLLSMTLDERIAKAKLTAYEQSLDRMADVLPDNWETPSHKHRSVGDDLER